MSALFMVVSAILFGLSIFYAYDSGRGSITDNIEVKRLQLYADMLDKLIAFGLLVLSVVTLIASAYFA